MPEKLRRVGNALLSVSDKTGIVDLARALVARGIEVISTGGTARSIAEAGIPVRDVAEVTGFPEMMDGRVKTLHPKVHGGLLARREDPEHQAALFAHGIPQIDLLVANLYPFEAAVAAGAAPDAVIEQIDIGGPAMIRAGAKNCDGVAVVTDPADYLAVLAELDQHEGATRFAFRRAMAAKAFARIARYDAAIDAWFSAYAGDGTPAGGHALRYGENPHQAGWVVPDASIGRAGVLSARLVQGKELSYNNIADADAAFEAVAEFDPARTAAVVIVKHANPCGVAEAETLEAAYRRALACDPVSAFGGIIALNRPLDAAVARAIADIFTEVVIAPDADDAAKAIIATKKNLRLMLAGALPDPAAAGRVFRSVAGGMLVQSRDGVLADALDLRVVTERAPSTQEMADLKFAWRVAKHVKSNAIVYARHGATVGIGAGQMSRVDSARIAAWKAGEAARAAGAAEPLTVGSVAASDAFFPFADGLEAVVSAGATAVIQPGGSVRDGEVIATANKAGIAMVFTGVRHFRH